MFSLIERARNRVVLLEYSDSGSMILVSLPVLAGETFSWLSSPLLGNHTANCISQLVPFIRAKRVRRDNKAIFADPMVDFKPSGVKRYQRSVSEMHSCAITISCFSCERWNSIMFPRELSMWNSRAVSKSRGRGVCALPAERTHGALRLYVPYKRQR